MSFLVCLLFYTLINMALLSHDLIGKYKSQCLALSGLSTFVIYLNLSNLSWVTISPQSVLNIVVYLVFLFLFWVMVRYLRHRFRYFFAVALLLILASMLVVRIYQMTFFWGYAYISLRLIWLLFEIKDGSTSPNLSDYTAFVFFFPSLCVGPVFSYSEFKKQLTQTEPPDLPLTQIFLRLSAGLIKLIVFAPTIHPLATSQLVFTGFKMGVADHIMSLLTTYIYIYAAFSGAIDVAIAASMLCGISLPENFNNPIKARNLSEFWTRWNISVSRFFAAHVFFPLQKSFQRRFRKLNLYSAPFFIFITMFLMGLWHGLTLNLLIYGSLHGVGLALHSTYLRFKPRLQKKYPHFINSSYYQVFAWFITHSFIALTLPFFMLKIFPLD